MADRDDRPASMPEGSGSTLTKAAPVAALAPAAAADIRWSRREESAVLAREWRRLGRAATFVALLTSPALFVFLHHTRGWSLLGALAATLAGIVAFRGVVDIAVHRLIPSPSLYGADAALAESDIVARRRLWFWGSRLRLVIFLGGLLLTIGGIVAAVKGESLGTAIDHIVTGVPKIAGSFPSLGLLLVVYFFFNFFILMGPLLAMGIQQIKGYEPGDADWGVRLEDVRGQREAKEEVTRIVSLWQSGEEFERAGGKRERGVLFNGPPGTGKTMLSKAIATNFNCPFVSIPGSGFAQTFIGLDAVIVRFLARKAKRLARKWGGQCIVFIDEIDAVGMRRQSLGAPGAGGSMGPGSFHDHAFYGPYGALNPSGDLILESRAWRDRLFDTRAPAPPSLYPPWLQRLNEGAQRYILPGGMGMGGGMALNQLLVVMDGIDDPPALRRFVTGRINTWLDALYIVPRRIGRRSLRLPAPRPRKEEVYFIGACNTPLEALDPALIRPGRMGRHVWFRTPTKDDRKDIFELYLDKVAHEADLDSERRRDELARMTNGYSPAMIEQICSMALTHAHANERPVFGWSDLVEAMTTVESGTAVGVEYVPAETRAVAIHEAGHAVAAHIYMKDVSSTRLSIRKRGGSLGHHQAIEKEERFSSWRNEEVAKLVWTLGAMAAEHVFYDENSTGVGGDVQSATDRAKWMVGMCAMAPDQIRLDGRFATAEEAEQESERLMKRFEQIGIRIMNRASVSTMYGVGNPLDAVMADRDKRQAIAQLLGQAYVTAYNAIAHNRAQVEHVAEVLAERKELHGDEVIELLDQAQLARPQLDLLDPRTWPKV